MSKKQTTKKRRKTSKGMEGKNPLRATIKRRSFAYSETKRVMLGGKWIMLDSKRGK